MESLIQQLLRPTGIHQEKRSLKHTPNIMFKDEKCNTKGNISTIVCFDDSKVICESELLIGSPYNSGGELSFHVSTLSNGQQQKTNKLENGLLEDYLDSIYKGEDVFDLKQLFLEPCNLAIKIVLNVVCVSDCGRNMRDIISIAVGYCLKKIKIPIVNVNDNMDAFISDTDFKSLQFDNIPISITCGISEDIILANLNNEEMSIADGYVSCVFDKNQRLLQFTQNMNYSALNEDLLKQSIQHCLMKSIKMREILNLNT